MACAVQDRPVILLGHRNDEPARLAFVVAHEVGHIAAGDCAPNQPVVDEEDEIADDAEMELRADTYAMRALVGADAPPTIERAENFRNFRNLARDAFQLERRTGVDAGMIIYAWAARTRDYSDAALAVKALYRGGGGRRLLRRYFDRHVDVDAASESDRCLLRCVFGDPETDGPPN